MKKYPILFILLISNFLLAAQENGKPIIQTYDPSEYKGHNQNWSITEDLRGVIYIGNQDSAVMEFDGTNWRYISTSNASAVRSLATDTNGRIYVGAVDDFGYLESNSQGVLHFKSLLHLTDSSNRKFGEIWSICTLNEKIFFQARNNIFLYENKKIKHWNLNGTYHRGFVVNNNYYVRQDDIGLTVFEKDTFLLIKNGNLFSNESVSAMLSFSETEILIGTRNKGLYLYNELSKSIKEFPKTSSSYFTNSSIYHGVRIMQDKFAFATLNMGILIINKSGELVQIIDDRNGLPTNGILYLYNQRDESLWAGTQLGIVRIDINSPIQFWDKDFGIDGVIYCMERMDNLFYIGSITKLLYWQPGNKNTNVLGRFQPINDFSTQVTWDLLKLQIPCKGNKEYKLIACTSYGLYEIKNKRAKQITKLRHSYAIYTPKKNPYLIFIVNNYGIYQVKYNCKADAWSEPEKLNLIEDQIRFIAEDAKNNIWVASMYNGYYKISFNNLNDNNLFENYSFNFAPVIENFKNNCGLPKKTFFGLMNIDNDIGFLTRSGFYRFNEESKVFYEDSIINNQLVDKTTVRAIQDNNGNLWFDSNRLFMKKAKNKYIADTIRLRRLRHDNFKRTFPDENDVVWLGSTKLYKVNLNDSVVIKKDFHTLIRSVYVNTDSLLFGGTYSNDSNVVCFSQMNQLKPELNYQYNSITFEYSAPYYIEQERIQYSFKLEGFDKKWSNWSPETKKEYTNLNHGNYTFKVKAINIYNQESVIAAYEFSILTPVYKSVVAYFFYLILLVLLMILIVRLYTKRLKKANIRLENIVKERTSEIRKKNKELTKLSIVASETDNAIVIMDKDGNFEWFNNGHVKFFGYEYNEYLEVLGSNILEISTNKNIKELLNECLSKKRAVTYESRGLKKNKEPYWTHVTLTPVLSKDGEVKKLVSIEFDIKKLKEYEADILAKNEEISAQRDALAEANATKDKFFSIISHDLKSPFNAILGFSEMLDENIPALPKDKIAKFNHQIFTSAKQLFSLVENLLSWSRTKSGKIQSYPEKLDLNKLIDVTCSIMNMNAMKKNIQLNQNIPDNTYVFADENLIATVVRNLLSNAIKYSRESSTINISAINKEKTVEISIVDSGIGIKKENIDKLFRENIHFTTQGTNQEKGTGLGLILCKEFVEKNGGKIWVDSEEGKGTTFTFTIPIYSEK